MLERTQAVRAVHAKQVAACRERIGRCFHPMRASRHGVDLQLPMYDERSLELSSSSYRAHKECRTGRNLA
jgi:hypothetical protein